MTDRLRGLAERKLRWTGLWLGTVAVTAAATVVLLVLGEPAADPAPPLRMPPAPALAALVALAVVSLVLLAGRRGWHRVRESGTPPTRSARRAVLVLTALTAGVVGAFWLGIYPLDTLSEGAAAMEALDWAAAAVAVVTFLAGIAPGWLLPSP